MNKIFTLILPFLFAQYFSLAQIQGGVALSNIQACSGATLIASPIWLSGEIHPVTLNFEKQVGTNWVNVRTMVYVNGGNFIIITPSDITTATSYRVMARDENTTEEFTSTAVIVNPATWNADRGTDFITAIAKWGGFSCGSEDDYIEVLPYLSGGRPPYKVEYKSITDANYSIAASDVLWAAIYNIVPGTQYSVRVTDFCGKVTTINNIRLSLEVSISYLLEPTNCNDGIIRLAPAGGIEHRGLAPFTYAIGKYTADMITIRPELVFGTDSAFNNLAPGDYDVQLKDACGNLSNLVTIRFGGGLPRLSVSTVSVPADSCFRTVTLSTFTGTPPFEYGIMAPGQTRFTYQSENVFENLSTLGLYFFKLKDKCGDSSSAQAVSITFTAPIIDSVSAVPTSSACIKNLVVHGGIGLKPYSYALRSRSTGNFVYQSSNTFTDVAQGLYDVSIRDRCGRISSVFQVDISNTACTIRTTPGDFEIAATQGCSDMTGSKWIDALDDAGNIIFSINPNNNLLQQVCWGVRIVDGMGSSLRSAAINGSVTNFLDRNFYIEPSSATVLSQAVSLRLYVSDAEINNMLWYLQNNGFPAATIADLKILKKKGSAGSPVDLQVTNENVAPSSDFTLIQPTIKRFGADWYMEFTVTDFSEFNPFMGNLSVLPLNFISFTGKKQNSDVALEWMTSHEMNTYMFEIEHSSDAINFSAIGEVRSKNTAGINQYTFTHTAPLQGNNFYRLKQIDLDGRSAYSSIIKIVRSGTAAIMVYPNPATNIIQVSLQNNTSEKIRRMELIDLSGKRMLQKDQPGTTTFSIDGLPAGMYWLRVTTATSVYTIKILKQ